MTVAQQQDKQDVQRQDVQRPNGPQRPRPAGPQRTPGDARAMLVAGWALLGLCALFGQAIVRLGARAFDTIAAGLTPAQWALLVGLTAVFVYTEGIRGIQGRFAPRVAARLHELMRRRRLHWDLLGPLYLLSLVGAPPRSMLRAWAGVFAIVAAVMIVRTFVEPWRGITDFAVVTALSWGLVAVVIQSVRSLRSLI